MDIRAVAFDTGGTVLDWHAGLVRAFERVGARHGVTKDWHAVANDWRRRTMKGIVGQGFGQLAREVYAKLGHHRDDDRMHLLGGQRPGGVNCHPVAGLAGEEGRGHLGAAGVLNADEEHAGPIGHVVIFARGVIRRVVAWLRRSRVGEGVSP